MKKWQIVLIVIAVPVLVFLLGLAGLGWRKFFIPKHENIRREVFENTKSYTHGKIQDLAKYFEEYTKTDDLVEKTAIQGIVKMRFAEFDSERINSATLRRFLISMRGY